MNSSDYRPPVTVSRPDYLRDGTDTQFRESIYGMIQATNRLLVCREAFSKELGLTQSQYAVLMGVAYRQSENGVAIKALADHVALAPTHVTTDVGRLERKGLLIKRQSDTDKRSQLVSLSPEGEAAVARVAPLIRQINDLLFQDIEPERLEIARQVARNLAVNADQAITELRRRKRQAKKPA